MFFFYILASAFLYVGGDVLGKMWAISDDWRWFWVGLFLYALGGVASFYSVREESLSLALLIIPPIAIVLSLLAGRFMFDEKLSSLQYGAGLVILLTIVVLLWNPKF